MISLRDLSEAFRQWAVSRAIKRYRRALRLRHRGRFGAACKKMEKARKTFEKYSVTEWKFKARVILAYWELVAPTISDAKRQQAFKEIARKVEGLLDDLSSISEIDDPANIGTTISNAELARRIEAWILGFLETGLDKMDFEELSKVYEALDKVRSDLLAVPQEALTDLRISQCLCRLCLAKPGRRRRPVLQELSELAQQASEFEWPYGTKQRWKTGDLLDELDCLSMVDQWWERGTLDDLKRLVEAAKKLVGRPFIILQWASASSPKKERRSI